MQTESGPPKRSGRSHAIQLLILCLLAQATTVFGLSFNVPLASLTNHNTSACSNYSQAFPAVNANFGNTSVVDTSGDTIPIDPNQEDMSLNPVSPGHVSHTDVHTLIPSRPDLRWFANGTCWWGEGPSHHVDNGTTNTTAAYAAAMVNDMESRGFNGMIFSWYGIGDQTDIVAKNVQAYLNSASNPNTNFTFTIMIVCNYLAGGEGSNNFVTTIKYCENNYFGDAHYEKENGHPLLMFFNVYPAYITNSTEVEGIKANTSANTYWVQEGTGELTDSWVDMTYLWTDDHNGANTNWMATDPYNLNTVTNNGDFTKIRNNPNKPAYAAMCAHFNGTLTKSLAWSLGKYLPCDGGLCEVERAAAINAAIPANVTRMQWATWSDYEEGTEVELGVENNFALTTSMISSNILSWTITSGDERTIDHYEVYALTNGGNAALLCEVTNGIHQANVSQLGLVPGSYQLYVDAVGKPCIRDHLSTAVAYTGLPQILPPPWIGLDIGSPGVGGTANYTNGTFTVQGSGTDIWGGSDAFQYVYQQLGGSNGQIVAEVDSINATNPWAKAALMFRASLAANSANGIIFVSPTEGVSMQSRTTAGGSTTTLNTIPGAAPYWISLVLSNNVLTGYASPDGLNWTPVGTNIISLGAAPFVGMAVTSKANSVLNTSAFSNFAVSAAATPGATLQSDLQPLFQTVWQGTPVSFTVTGGGVGILNYQWTLNGRNISGATNAGYAFAALAGTNYYMATISNSFGSANSSTGEVVGEPGSFLSTTNDYYGTQITFSGDTNGGSLQDFPVLVCLSTNIPGFSYAQFASPTDGADLRFTDAGGTRLIPFEIEQWNTGGVSTAWVQVPVLSTNTSIRAYWGDAASAPALPATNVWMTQPWEGLPSFDAVYHLKESGFPFADSTGQNPALTGSAPALTTGIIGTGENFAADSYLDAGVINVGNTFTLSAWVNIATNAGNIQAIWASKAGSSSNGFAFYVNTYSSGGSDDQRLLFETSDHASTPTYYTVAAGDVSSNQWHQVVAVVNRAGGTAQLYVDGASIPCAGGVLTDFNTNQDVRLGEFEGNAFPLNGLMDEARIHSGLESSNWVWASYMTVAANSTFENYSLLSSPVVTLNIQNIGGSVILTWPAGQLQSAGQMAGPYADVPGATPPFTNTVSGTQQFFRVKIQ